MFKSINFVACQQSANFQTLLLTMVDLNIITESRSNFITISIAHNEPPISNKYSKFDFHVTIGNLKF